MDLNVRGKVQSVSQVHSSYNFKGKPEELNV